MPVATSETVPSPPTAMTTVADRAAVLAALVASNEELTTWTRISRFSSPRRINDALISSGLTRLALLTMASTRCIGRRVTKFGDSVDRPAGSGIRTRFFRTEDRLGDVVRQPCGCRNEDE